MSVIKQPDPINVLSPIDIEVDAFIVLPEIPTLFPIIILLLPANILNRQGWITPIEFEQNLLLQVKFLPIRIVPPS